MFDVVTCDSVAWHGMECDMLFIDSHHTYRHCSMELERHGDNSRRWILFHDTETFGATGEDGGRGLMRAVWEFLGRCPHWELTAHWRNCNGLTLLRRVR